MCVDGGGVPGVRPRSWSGPGDLSGGGSRGFGPDADLDPRIWSRSDDPIWIRGSVQSCTIFLEVLLVPFPLRSRWFWWWWGGAGPGVWRKCEALLVPVPSSQEPLVGEQVLWFDPDIKLPPGVVEELTWWVGAGGSLWVGAACYVVSAAGRCRLADAVGGKWKGGRGCFGRRGQISLVHFLLVWQFALCGGGRDLSCLPSVRHAGHGSRYGPVQGASPWS